MGAGGADGAVVAWDGTLTRRLAAFAMRRATDERVDREEGEAALRLVDLLVDLVAAVAVAAVERLRVPVLARPDVAAVAFPPVLALGLALVADRPLALERVARGFAGALDSSAVSSTTGATATAGDRRRARVEGAALARAAEREVGLRVGAGAAVERVRWLNTRAHSSSLRVEGLEPWAWAMVAALSISAIRLSQEVAKRLSDCDLAPLSKRVSTTPSAVTFLRRRLKISF